MDYVFEVIDKSGRKMHLSKERWQHICLEHSDFISIGRTDDTIHYYYKFYKIKKEYLIVSVKYLNGDGYIVTSFRTRKARQT